jgi:hypothetical protein
MVLLAYTRGRYVQLSAKRMSTKRNKKSKGIYIIERRSDSLKMVKEIAAKKWDDVCSIDLYILYENKWTTSQICDQFKITSLTVIHRIRYR